MHRKKIATLTLALLFNSYTAPTIEALADGLSENISKIEENNEDEIESNKATVSRFDLYNEADLTEYNKIYKIDNKNITMTNNGGVYGNSTTDKALDGNLSTHWETGTPNHPTFTNEVVFTFDKETTLSRIVYAARQDVAKGKGFAKEFEIYASKTESGDDFTLVSQGSYEGSTGDLVEIKFDKTTFKRLKFRFTNPERDWASASEFMFYKEDLVWDKLKNLFTNGLMNELSEEFNTEEKLNALEKEFQSHPLKSLLEQRIEYAKEVLENRINSNDVIEVERRGNSVKESEKRKLWSFEDWQVTGLTARPGDVLQVYVDVKDGEPTPTLVYKQSSNRNATTTTFKLSRGKNTIVIPQYNNESDPVEPNTIFGGALYITNYDSDKQTQAPRVRIEGGQKYPMYVDGKSNDEQVMKELETYVEKVKKDPQNTVDLFDISTNQTLVTVKATYALDWYKNNHKVPSYTANRWEEIMDKIYKFWGFDNSTELNSRFNSRIIFMIKNHPYNVFMNAYRGTVAVRPDCQDNLLDASTGWGLMHEIGHNMDTSGRTMTELTNNILPIYIPTTEGGVTRITTDNVWERKIYPKVAKEDYSNNVWQDPSGEDSLAQLSPLWQLNLYDNTFYPKFEQTYRANDFKLKNRDEIIQSWVKVSSDILKLNLCEFFERHGIHPSEKIKSEVSKYPKPDKKLWYLNDNKLNYKGNGFSEDSKVDLSIKRLNNSVKLKFNIDKNSKSDLLGYEIVKDDKVIGFTSTNTFTDTNVDYSKNSIYKVIPYDNNLGTGKPATINLFSPNISVKQNKITLKLNEEFNPKDYIKALDYKNNDIISKVNIESNVNTKKDGLYKVKYTVNDDGFKAEKTVDVEVVSDYKYLSDNDWNSVETQWGTPSRNKDLKGQVNGEEKTFEKGFGIHANGKVTYDLSGKDYDKFEALVGVNHATIGENENSSIKFKVVADGKTLITTDTIRYSDDMVYISVPVKGVNTLEIQVTDSDNGNAADHGLIANPILIINNTKPKLLNISNKTIKLGQKINLKEGIKAVDAEEGDLTSDMVINGEVDFNKPGVYPLTYSITDRDGNKVEKTRTISIVDMKQGTYLSDINWKSATCGWRSIQKDKSIEQNPLRLTGKNGEAVEYKKGIGTHSDSTIVYDLTGKNYTLFTSYIGVDREMYNSSNSSVNFKIYVDGVLKYDSGVMKANDEQKYVQLNIKGAKELKLEVTDSKDGNAADHASFADAKLYTITDKDYDYLSDNNFKCDEIQGDAPLRNTNLKGQINGEDNTFEKGFEIPANGKIIYDLSGKNYKTFEALVGFNHANIDQNENSGLKFKVIADGETLATTDTIKYSDDMAYISVPVKGVNTLEIQVTNINNTDDCGLIGNPTLIKDNEEKFHMIEGTYLSDISWKSATCGWRNIQKDKSIEENPLRLTGKNGEAVEYKKGIGTHSNSTIVYDLTDKNYTLFTSYIGVDREMYNSPYASISFNIYVDGVRKYSSGIMHANDGQKYVALDLTDAKELKLEVIDAGDGNSADHASFADAKLYSFNDEY